MSITAPMHWTMVPDVWASAMFFPSRTCRIRFPLSSPPHLEEGCPRSGRGDGGAPAQQAGWVSPPFLRRRACEAGGVVCAPTTTPRLRRTPPQERRGKKRHTSLGSYRRSADDHGRSHRRRAADDLGDLFGDPRLAVLVVDERQLVDQGLGVVRGGLHRDHARALLRGHVLG